MQQRGADTNGAFNFYSAVIAALNAIGSQSVPAVPTFGAAATQDYCYGLSRSRRWSLSARFPVGPMVSRACRLWSPWNIRHWAYGSAAIRLSAVGTMTG